MKSEEFSPEKSMTAVEKSIECLHADVRSIRRQIEAKSLGSILPSEEPELREAEERVWTDRALSTVKRKLAQIRFLERDLGEMRRGEYEGLEKYFYISILARVARLAYEYDKGFDEDDIDEEWASIRNELQHLKTAAPKLLSE